MIFKKLKNRPLETIFYSIFQVRYGAEIEIFNLIARREYGPMVQILSGLIIYLLLAIYCMEQHN